MTVAHISYFIKYGILQYNVYLKYYDVLVFINPLFDCPQPEARMSKRGGAMPSHMKQLLDPSTAGSSHKAKVGKPKPPGDSSGSGGSQGKSPGKPDAKTSPRQERGAAAKHPTSTTQNGNGQTTPGDHTTVSRLRQTLKSTLAVWLWIWHVEKRRMNMISRSSSVNYTVNVQEDENVLVDVYPVGPQPSPSTLPDAVDSVHSILTAGKSDYPVAIDVTGFELEAEEHVATNQTGCFVCQSPDDRTVLVGPFKEALMVYSVINPDADLDALAKVLVRRSGYKNDAGKKKKPLTPSPPPPPPPPVVPKPPKVHKITDGPVTILPTKNTKEGLFVDKYLWMFLKHAFSDKIKRVINPYKTKEYTDNEYTLVNLIPSNANAAKVQKRLFDLVFEYERKCQHHVITVKDPLHQKQVDEVAKRSELSLICREDEVVHIVTLGDKMEETKQIIYDILAGKYGLDDDQDDGQDGEKGRDKYLRKVNFKWAGRSNIHIFEGNLTNLRVDAIVNPANSALHNADGISKAISRAAGPELDNECKMRVANKGRLVVSKNYVSRSYHLPCKNVIHMVGPMWKSYDDKDKCEKHLNQTFANCLKEAYKMKFKTIGIAVDSSGQYLCHKF